MPEQQNEEWKEVWRDEYLRWICGFANAQGGRIYIGIDDNGKVVGVDNYSRLMEDIPNKIVQNLGIVADVNLLEENGLFYIEINVAPASYAVNYKGEYHYRSGSTRQQLKGSALSDFLLRKAGRQVRWDAEPEAAFNIEDLDVESFKIFRNAARISGRITEEDLQVNNAELLERLNLLTPQGQLKRAAVLLFYRQPERMASGCYVKIGKFGKGADLQYQEEVHGSLFVIADRVLDVIYLKYLKASIGYQNDIRVERYPYPREALREIVYNALIHSNWAMDEPVQIKITEECLSISNVGILPPGWTCDSLLKHHKSKPFNPHIANAFFRAGYVETWGRGIEKVREICMTHGCDTPEFEIIGEDVTVTFRCHSVQSSVAELPKNSTDACQGKLTKLEQLIILSINENPMITQKDISIKGGVTIRAVQKAIKKLQDAQIIRRNGSQKKGTWCIIDTRFMKH